MQSFHGSKSNERRNRDHSCRSTLDWFERFVGSASDSVFVCSTKSANSAGAITGADSAAMKNALQVNESQLDSTKGIAPRERLLTIREAAEYLAVSVSTLYGWVWQRRIPFIKMGRALRFDPHDLAAFIEANKYAPRKVSHPGSRTNTCYNTGAAGKG